MAERSVDAAGLVFAPIEAVREALFQYICAGCDQDAIRHTLLFVIAFMSERTLTAKLMNRASFWIGNRSITVHEADIRINELQRMPVF